MLLISSCLNDKQKSAKSKSTWLTRCPSLTWNYRPGGKHGVVGDVGDVGDVEENLGDVGDVGENFFCTNLYESFGEDVPNTSNLILVFLLRVRFS